MIEEEKQEKVGTQESEKPTPEAQGQTAKPEADPSEEAAAVREPKFINDTALTPELQAEAQLAVGRNGRIILLVLGIAFAVFGFGMGMVDALVYYEFNVWAIGLTVIGFMLGFVSNKRIMRKGLLEKFQGRNAVTRHVFYIDGFEFRSRITIGTLTTDRASTGNFSAFTQIKESKNFWIIYYGKMDIDVIDKRGMKQGDAAELSRFLAVRLGPKYKVCYR